MEWVVCSGHFAKIVTEKGTSTMWINEKRFLQMEADVKRIVYVQQQLKQTIEDLCVLVTSTATDEKSSSPQHHAHVPKPTRSTGNIKLPQTDPLTEYMEPLNTWPPRSSSGCKGAGNVLLPHTSASGSKRKNTKKTRK